MTEPKYEIGDRYRTCPECGNSSLYLLDAFTYVCLKDECDEHFPLEYFVYEEPELYDMDGDKIIY